jgi:histone H3/H4
MDFVKANLVKSYMKDNGAGAVSPGTIVIINNEVQRILDNAVQRAKANSRNTVMGRDI